MVIETCLCALAGRSKFPSVPGIEMGTGTPVQLRISLLVISFSNDLLSIAEIIQTYIFPIIHNSHIQLKIFPGVHVLQVTKIRLP